MPENEILLTAYPYYPAKKSLSEQFVSLRLGRLLMDDPDLSSDTSPTECFEQVVEGILNDYEKLILKEIALMEHMHSATVYFVHISGGITYGMYTVRVSLFYVSSEISEWEWDREQLMNREPFVYAFDLRSSEEDYCADIGPVGFSIEDGQMRRLW